MLTDASEGSILTARVLSRVGESSMTVEGDLDPSRIEDEEPAFYVRPGSRHVAATQVESTVVEVKDTPPPPVSTPNEPATMELEGGVNVDDAELGAMAGDEWVETMIVDEMADVETLGTTVVDEAEDAAGSVGHLAEVIETELPQLRVELADEGRGIILRWASKSGIEYGVEYSGTMSSGSWERFAVVAGDGETLAEEHSGGGKMGFYRLVILGGSENESR